MTDIQHVELISANGDSRVVVSTWGGRVISWKHDGRDIVFRNAMLDIDEIASTHAGIPVLFPQFGFFGPGVKHGFVRETSWSVASRSREQCILILSADDVVGTADYPQFVARVIIQIDDNRLRVWLQVENADSSSSITFTSGLHTYLAVNDLSTSKIVGLQGINYLDATAELAPTVELQSSVDFCGEVDRVYLDTPAQLQFMTEESAMDIEQSGFEDTVVWNPGPDLGPKFKDFEPDEWCKFVCIEAAQIQNPVTLRPGESWTGSQTLTVR